MKEVYAYERCVYVYFNKKIGCTNAFHFAQREKKNGNKKNISNVYAKEEEEEEERKQDTRVFARWPKCKYPKHSPFIEI